MKLSLKYKPQEPEQTDPIIEIRVMLQAMFNPERVTVDYIKPLNDEDFEACYMVCVDDVIVANPVYGFEACAKACFDRLLKTT